MESIPAWVYTVIEAKKGNTKYHETYVNISRFQIFTHVLVSNINFKENCCIEIEINAK